MVKIKSTEWVELKQGNGVTNYFEVGQHIKMI